MGSIVYLTNKKNGRVYAYINEKVYDRRTGMYKYRRKCIGHLNPETGEIEENRPKTDRDILSVQSIGIDTYLSGIASSCGLQQSLKMAFPMDWKLILSCAMYIISEMSPLSMIEPWSLSNRTPFGKGIEQQDIDSLLSSLDSDGEEAFMRIWRKTLKDERFALLLCRHAEFPTEEPYGSIMTLPELQSIQSETAVCFAMESRMPVSYIRSTMPSMDTESINGLLEKLYWVSKRRMTVVMDSGYGTDRNIGTVIREGRDFLLILPNSSKIAMDSISGNRERMVDSENYLAQPNGDHGFAMTLHDGPRGINTHLYYSEENAERDIGALFRMVDLCSEELRRGVPVAEHMMLYNRLFIKQGGAESGRAEVNSDKVMEYTSASGYTTMISDTITDKKEAIEWGIRLSQVNRAFSMVGNGLDSSRMRLFSEHNMESRNFIQFVAYILYCAVYNNLRDGSLMRDFTVRSAIKEMSGIMEVSGMGLKRPKVSGINYRQELLLKNADISL